MVSGFFHRSSACRAGAASRSITRPLTAGVAGSLFASLVAAGGGEIVRIDLDVPEKQMRPGERQVMDATVKRTDAEDIKLEDLERDEVAVMSLNPDVATVGSYGQIYARNPGAATLQVQVTLDGRTRTETSRIGVAERALEAEDFILDGAYGSRNSMVEKLGVNHFKFHRGGHPKDGNRKSTTQFIIPKNFRGNSLTLDMQPMGELHPGHNYYFAFSFDGKNWTPIRHRVIDEEASISRIEIPPTNSDRLYFGWSLPFSHEATRRNKMRWATDPDTRAFVTLHQLGYSLEGRKLYRLEVTDPESPHARENRWVHYISQAHPHEGKARWRVKGMIDWLLSDDPEAADARERHIWHFVLAMNPDGFNRGFTRMNMENIDMNRTYRVDGADRDEQAHEGYVFQRDIEALMDSDTPLTTFWDMHVWPGKVDPLLHPGPEFGDAGDRLGEWRDFRDLMDEYDEENLIQPLQRRRYEGNTTLWERGVHHHFGITSALVEGSGHVDTQEENLRSGRTMARAISAFWRDTRADMDLDP